MELSLVVLLVSFILLLSINTPIAVAIALATLATMLLSIDGGAALMTVAQRVITGVNSFSMLAIPFFILSGYLMGQGGMARRLIDFARVLVGGFPGGLAFVNVLACTLFGAISGSAVAATSAIGGFMIPAMNDEGYDKNFNTAITVTASTTGLLIPPSNILIIYSLASGGVSIAALFVAGYIPGLLVAASLMVVCGVYAKIKNFPTAEPMGYRAALQKTAEAVPSLFLILMIIGGIISGWFTPTEAGVISVVYALILSLLIYREINIGDLPQIFTQAVQTTAIVMLLIGASAAMSWMLSYENIPQELSAWMIGFADNPLYIILLINIILLLVGTFMDMTPAVLIFTPILLPVVESFGMSPLHFGIMMILNLSIGLCTPPVGSVLFVGCSVGQTSISGIIKPLLPMYLAMLAALILVTYIPSISLALPRLLGL